MRLQPRGDPWFGLIGLQYSAFRAVCLTQVGKTAHGQTELVKYKAISALSAKCRRRVLGLTELAFAASDMKKGNCDVASEECVRAMLRQSHGPEEARIRRRPFSCSKSYSHIF